MNAFLVDKGFVYDYNTLLTDVNDSDKYYPFYKTNNLYDFFVNLIVALVNNQPLSLIDSNITSQELELSTTSYINIAKEIKPFRADSLVSLIEKLRDSKSEITLFTSGTTGQPKKVVHSLGTLTRFIRISEAYQNQVWAFAYNPTHMAGLQVFFQAFQNYNTLINVFNLSRLDIFDAITTYQITHISATPTFYRLLFPAESTFKSVKRVTLGGEKSDKRLYDSISQIFPNAKLNNIYASTEGGSLFTSHGENFQIPANIQDKIKVVDDELLIHKSLLGKSEDFKFSGDYYCSGDLVEWIDKDLFIFSIKSRKNELINVGGYKVNPSEVENAILQIPDVLNAIVFGKANSILGNILCADVKVTAGSTLSEIEIRNYLSDKLQDFKIPRRIKFVTDFELTRTGKIKR